MSAKTFLQEAHAQAGHSSPATAVSSILKQESVMRGRPLSNREFRARMASKPTNRAGPPSSLTIGHEAATAVIKPTSATTAKLTDLKVSLEKRGQGLGRELVKDAARAAYAMGKSTIQLESQDNGTGRLTRWYERQGFRRKGKGKHGYEAMEAPIDLLLREPPFKAQK